MRKSNFTLFAAIVIGGFSVFSIALHAEFSYDSHGKRDPFTTGSKSRPTTKVEKKAVTNLKLEGVVLDPSGKSMAIVNGEMVSEGERLGGTILVKKITNQGVDFEQDGQLISIPIVTKD